MQPVLKPAPTSTVQIPSRRRARWLAAIALAGALAGVSIGSGLPVAHGQGARQAAPAAADRDREDVLDFTFDGERGTLSLVARDASLMVILRELRDKYGVDVTVPNLEDARVTARFADVPLNDALARLLPAGTRFHVDAGRAEYPVAGSAERRGEGARFPDDAPRKGASPRPDHSNVKPPAGESRPGERQGDVVKAAADEGKVRAGRGPKKPLDRTFPGRHGQLGLRVVDGQGVKPLALGEIEGELVRSERLEGALVYAVVVDGQVVEVGSAPHPLEGRAYLKDGRHTDIRAPEGELRIALSERLLDPEVLGRAVIKVYEMGGLSAPATDAVAPTELTPGTFEGFLPLLTPIGEVVGGEIVGLPRTPLGGHAVSGAPDTSDGVAGMAAHIPVVELLRSGGNGAKRDLVIIGDGFQADDQAVFNTYVDQTIAGVFGDDAFRETMNAFNIYRVNVDSTDEGVTEVDANGNVTTARTTALDFRYSGDWDRCWMEGGPNTSANLDAILDDTVPQRDFVFVVLNETGSGGCRSWYGLAVTRGEGWATASHEMGHMVGAQGDEYFDSAGPTYTGNEPGVTNLTKNTDRATLKWRNWVHPSTPLPTTCADVADMVQDVGLFAGATTGGTQFGGGIFRPTCDSRMRSNTPVFNPVGYHTVHDNLDAAHDFTFDDAYAGDFNGDGRGDLVLHNANSLALYVSKGSTLEAAWVATGEIPLWDDFMAGDRFFVGDFDGDGMDDLFVVNFADWAIPYFALLRSTGKGFECIQRFDEELPGWDDMKPGDQFFVADFNADGKDDLYVFNGTDWSMGYFELLRSTGTDLAYVVRYDEELPGWDDMKPGDQFFVADFNADGKDDIYVFNGTDWSVGYLEMLRATGGSLAYVRRYDEELPGWDDMKPGDKFYVADFNADGDEDLYVFNGTDWSMGYLQMLMSRRGQGLVNIRRYDGEVPGWDDLEPHDQFYAADVDGDGRRDLYAYNAVDWDSEYLGVLRSSGQSLAGSWQKDWINSWNLGEHDRFLVVNFNGGAGWDDLFVRNADWFGLLRSHSGAVGLTMINHRWIHDHRYHVWGWW